MEGKFYLGKIFEDGKLKDPVLYKASHLTTHAMVFGMTGSGKTGLCIDLLEEAIDEGIPIIAVDPKGDVANLALIFDELTPERFLPWISQEEAAIKGKTPEAYAAEMAERWKKGLEEWGIGEDRLRRVREKSSLRIFTPGSTAGELVNIITGFERPPADFNSDPELAIEKIKNSVSALLSLLGMDTDPIKSSPHILLSSIIEYFWRQGKTVSLEDLILSIQHPPIKKLGVFDVDSIMDEKDRMDFALAVNNLVASPNFRLWREGFPLDGAALYRKSEAGKTPVNIFYIAHLSESERMFFVSLLFNEVLAFIRTQPGSSQLKYLLYMDEIYGYLPAYPLNPPSKNPLLLLLKQARAFGLGIVLVTQNPKDVDYKGLTNMGTWFIGRLQAEGDRERVLEGLEGAVGSQGIPLDKEKIRKIITGLSSRVFLMHDAKEGSPEVFKTRWAMSYLAGPLTRRQIKILKEQRGWVPSQVSSTVERKEKQDEAEAGLLPYPPSPPPGLDVYYESKDLENPTYEPWLLFEAEVLFDEPKLGFYHRKRIRTAVKIEGKEMEEFKGELQTNPPDNAKFKPLPSGFGLKAINAVKKRFKDHLLSRMKLDLFYNRQLKLLSEPGESREAFALRCRQVVDGRLQREMEAMREKYQRRLEKLEDTLMKEKDRLEMLEARYKGRVAEEALSVGETILRIALGGKPTTALSRSARKRRMSAETKRRIAEKKHRIEDIKEDMVELQREMEEKARIIREKYLKTVEAIEPYPVRLEKDDIVISSVALLWR